MKHTKLRIAAAVMSAITMACASQAITASAFQYTGTPQYACEQNSTMGNYVSMWKGTTYKANSTWGTRYFTNGVVVGGGFTAANLEGSYEGQHITGDKGLCRSMARDYFGTSIFMQISPNARYHVARLGDQVTMTRNGVTKTVFVTYCNSPSLKVVELKNGKITYDNAYYYAGNTMMKGNETWTVDYVTRPIKQGDANGDGFVYAERYADYYGDLEAIANYANTGVPAGVRYDVLMAAASLDGDWQITAADHRILMYNLLTFNGSSYYYTTEGRMNGDWSYVSRLY